MHDDHVELRKSTTLDAIGAAMASVVALSTRRPRFIIVACLTIAAVSAAYVATHFEMRTDLDALLSDRLPWRAEANRVERAFPAEGDDIIVVVDGDTPERADRVAELLSDALSKNTTLFVSVRRANGGSYFAREGLLFQPQAEVTDTTARLIASQPLLGPIAADPSLRGLMSSLETAFTGAIGQPTRMREFNGSADQITHALMQSRAGYSAQLSWRALLSGTPDTADDLRQFIQIQPKLDYSDAMPAIEHTAFIRAIAQHISSTESGVRVRITGSAPISDDELKTLQESAGPIGIAMLFAMIAILFLAVRSAGVVFSILLSVAAGAIVTSALGLAIFHRFNLISVAFLPLFVGLGVDFAIQFCVRAAAENSTSQQAGVVLHRTASGIGGGVVLAVAATTAGFLAFLPTSYRGVSELGLIAAVGMLIALAVTFTLLPAVLSLLPPQAARHESGLKVFRDADVVIVRRHRTIVFGALMVGILAAFSLPMLQFNFDPMALRSNRTESLAVYRELEQNADTTPNTLNVVDTTLGDARARAGGIETLPQVAHAYTLASFLPADQDAKLRIIEDARTLLDFTINPFDTASAPSDAELIAALRAAVVALRAPGTGANADLTSAHNLANELDHLAQATPQDRSRAQVVLLGGFPTALDRLKDLLSPQRITLETLPAELRRDWVSPSGLARVEIVPRNPLHSPAEIAAFVTTVRSVAPRLSGDAVTIVESGRTILGAFATASILSTVGILLLLLCVLRSVRWAGMAIIPVLLSGILTFATLAVTGQPINLENMIALPLLLGIGVAFNIYLVVARRDGAKDILRSSLAKAVVFSALTTGTAFAALALSSHPGTASMGTLLIVALCWILLTTLLFLPALMQLMAQKSP